MLRPLIVTLALSLASCASVADDARPTQNPPPSVALVPPNFYYHYRYNAKLHRRVREMIRAEDLRAPTPNEEKQQRIEEASDTLYRLRKGTAE